MKKKLIFGMICMCFMILSVPGVAKAKEVTVEQTGSGTDTAGKAGFAFSMTYNGTGTADGYRIYYGETKDSLSLAGDISVNEMTMTGLEFARKYYVRVEALKYSTALEVMAGKDESQVLGESDVVEMATPIDEAVEWKESGSTAVKDETSTSFTLTWSSVKGADGYLITNQDRSIVIGDVTTTTYQATGLTPNTTYAVAVVPYVLSESGYHATKPYTILTATTLPDTPHKVSLNEFSLSKLNAKNGKATILAVDTQGDASGYEYQLTNLKGKEIKSGTSIAGKGVSYQFKKNKPYVLKVRLFAEVNGNRVYGPWSDVRMICIHTKIKCKGNKKNITVTWKKNKKAAYYKVLISKNKKTGYKVAKKVKSKVSKVVINKYNKKPLVRGIRYYERIRSYWNVNGKIVANSVF